jgi:sugar phosphate isomerase/epimerase
MFNAFFAMNTFLLYCKIKRSNHIFLLLSCFGRIFMKLSVFTVMTPDLTPEELVSAAAAAGITGIEWRYAEISKEAARQKPSYWGNNLATIVPGTTEEELESYLQLTQSKGLKSISVTPYLTCGDVAGTEKVMKAARKLGAGFIRVGVPTYDRTKNYPALFAEAVDYLHHVQELSQQYGIKALVETHHKFIAPSASLAHRLVSGFDPEHIGVLHDAGNMVHEGFENYRMGLELLGPYLAHVHVKNAGWIRTGSTVDGSDEWTCSWMVNWKLVLSDLKAVGYDGYLGFEDFSGQSDSRTLLKSFAQNVKEWSS